MVARLAWRVLIQQGDGTRVLVYAELHIQEPCLDGGVEGGETLLQGLGLVVDGIDESGGRVLNLGRDELARAVDLQGCSISPFWFMAKTMAVPCASTCSLSSLKPSKMEVLMLLRPSLVVCSRTVMAPVFSSMATFMLARFLSSKVLRASKRSCNVLLRLLTASTREE